MPEAWFLGVGSYAIPIMGLASPGTRLLRKAVTRIGERQLGQFVLPPFQRPAVWSHAQREALVTSLWEGLPVGSYVWNGTNRRNPCDGWLLDGQQRMSAIIEYVAGAFPVMGWRYPDLPEADKRWFGMRTMAGIQTSLEDPARCREVYERLARGGTPHGPADAATA